MSQADLYLVRHGQTDWNASQRLQGSQETDLNEKGRLQAADVGKRLLQAKVVAIYSSPMKRARQTAEIIQTYHDCPIHYDPALREAWVGELEGATNQEFQQRCKDQIEKYLSLSHKERLEFRFVPGYETIAEVIDRVSLPLRQIAKNHLGQSVIVVTHGKVLKSLIEVQRQIDTLYLPVANGGILHLRTDGYIHEIVNLEGIPL